MKQVSVIIINYNTAMLTQRCIDAVVAHTAGIDYEIIVVDNHSAESGIERVTATSPRVTLLHSGRNAGFGAACNLAASVAQGTYLFLLNPDTEIRNNALSLFYDFHQQYEQALRIACSGTLLHNRKGGLIHSYHHFPDRAVYIKHKIQSLLRLFRPEMARELAADIPAGAYFQVDYVTGADLFISKARFAEAGGFDPGYFMYFEESDLQYRLSGLGYQSYVLRGPDILHEQDDNPGRDPVAVRIMYTDSLLLFIKKHSSLLQYLSFRVIWLLLDMKTLLLRWRSRSRHRP